jgi:release factor glutamine methyltransferase
MAVVWAELLRSIAHQLRPVAGDLALVESENILQHVLECSRSELYLRPDESIPYYQLALVRKFTCQRLTGTPLPYVLGIAHFRSLQLRVSRNVLIPRPDTEILVQIVLNLERGSKRRYLDMGTGSGAICAALSAECPSWSGVGVDISEAALRIAKINCFGRRVFLLCCDLFSALHKHSLSSNKDLIGTFAGPGFDFVVSNPPYVSDSELPDLDDSVKAYEPMLALDGGKLGLSYYQKIAVQAKDMLVHSGRLYFEIGATQRELVVDLLARNGWKNIQVFNDLANRPRVVHASL